MNIAAPVRPSAEITPQQSRLLAPDMTELLGKVIWGTDEALYQVIGFEKTLKHLPVPHYVTLRQSERLLAMQAGWLKTIYVGSQPVNSAYHSLLAVDPSEQGKGYGRRVARDTFEHLRSQIESKGLLYAYIENGNTRSENVFRPLGYQKLGEFFTVAFSRFFPNESAHVRLLKRSEAPDLCHQLWIQYGPTHALMDFDFSLDPSAYWVYADGHGIAAGVQVYPQHWRIRALAGAGGAAAMRLLPRFPVVRDIFNPQNFQFLKIGNVFFRPGCEKVVFRLVEAVLARHQRKTAIAYFDKRSPVYQSLAVADRFGLLNAMVQTQVNVMGYPHRLDTREIASIQDRPLVISPLDV